MNEQVLIYASWASVVILCLGYWFQVWKIHVHKEVRDISLASYIMLCIGFSILAFRAYHDSATIFMVKQLSTLLPVSIICFQVIKHKEDTWHDDDDPNCTNCAKELEPHWQYCAYCGTKNELAKGITA